MQRKENKLTVLESFQADVIDTPGAKTLTEVP
jgi:hypothetical protein